MITKRKNYRIADYNVNKCVSWPKRIINLERIYNGGQLRVNIKISISRLMWVSLFIT